MPSLDPVLDSAWLRAHLEEVVVADVRWYLDGRSGREAYRDGHIQGAVWVDLDTVLAGPATTAGGRHPVPDATDFALGLGALGIGDGTTVVAYDDNHGAYAARLVWLLRRTGRNAALLDAGLAAWDGKLETGYVQPSPVPHTVVEWPPDLFRTADDVTAALASGSAVVLDARAADRYTGENVLPSDVRSGHIPGARSAPWADNLAGDGSFASPEKLREHYGKRGVTRETDVVVYCGSGVTACHDLLALERAGVGSTALYPGSWSAWSADLARPVAERKDA
ncbi:MAG TPA: sulfurtransferase [Amycolatopsis sp.]|nr:sulfurtransferase [Amycolatopsis sp.]